MCLGSLFLFIDIAAAIQARCVIDYGLGLEILMERTVL